MKKVWRRIAEVGRLAASHVLLPGQRVGQRRQPVQRVVLVVIARSVGRHLPGAVRRRVVGVRVLEVVSRQERVLRARPDQASHVVVGESVRGEGGPLLKKREKCRTRQANQPRRRSLFLGGVVSMHVFAEILLSFVTPLSLGPLGTGYIALNAKIAF